MFLCGSSHWILLSIQWNLLLKLPRAAFVESRRESNLIQNLNWRYDRNHIFTYLLDTVLWKAGFWGYYCCLGWFDSWRQASPLLRFFCLRKERKSFLLSTTICLLSVSPDGCLLDYWCLTGQIFLFVINHIFGWRQRGGRQAEATKRKHKEKLQTAHKKHFPEGMPLPPPQPVALLHLAQPPQFGKRGLRGICVGFTAATALAWRTLPWVPGNTPEAILVCSKDLMFWILSSSLCQLHLEELQAAQKTKQCNNSKNTVHLRASKGLCTHSMKVRGGFFRCSTAFLPSCLASLQQGVTEIIIYSGYVKHSIPEFIISRARKRIKKSRKDVERAHIGSSSRPPVTYVDKEHCIYRQK